MWVRVERSKIPPMQRCRTVTVIEGKLEPEMGESLQFWEEPDTLDTYYEVWVEGRVEEQLPRKAYLSGWFDAIEAIRKEMGKFNLTPPSNFKD